MKTLADKTYLIGSGKGGVGKSTITVNLAVELAKRGLSVGLFDADLYGPSIPIMLGLRNLSPKVQPDGSVIPFTKFGIQVISLGFFVEEKRGMVWRGPMLHKMVEKMLFHVHWPKLDYFLIDLPPGTGDILLSLAQLIWVTGGLIVTTPQEVAVLDALKAINAFDQLNVPLLGIIENMTGITFGSGKGDELASNLSIPLLASLPLDENVCKSGDRGVPAAVHSAFFHDLAHNVSTKLK